MDTMPRAPRAGGARAPRGPMGGTQLANRNAMQRQMEAAIRDRGDVVRQKMLSEARVPLGGASVPQRPIPNRDGRLAQLQADIARAQKLRGQQSLRGVFSPDRANPSRNLPLRPMPQSNYARQQMPPQQIQRGMGRLPMARANIGQIQTPLPAFTTQMRQPIPRRRIPRRRR